MSVNRERRLEAVMEGPNVDSVIEPGLAREAENGFVDVGAAHRDSNIEDVLAELDSELVGLKPVKARIREIASLLLVARLREKMELSTERPTLHMSFTGHPGTGKTTVAMRMAKMLHHMGYVRKGHLVAVTRDDLVGQYIGHTAPKTKEVLKRAMGGVLFVDEAYYLYRPENERDYGQEAIEILLQVMENQREDLVVILAGYKDRMDTFFQSNPGMSSRIAHHIDFPDYSLDELTSIGDLMVAEAGYRLSPAAEATFRDYLARRREQPRFSNARSVRNALERARLRHAGRVLAGEPTAVTKDDLMRLEPEDFLLSRVFTAPPALSGRGPSRGGRDRRGSFGQVLGQAGEHGRELGVLLRVPVLDQVGQCIAARGDQPLRGRFAFFGEVDPAVHVDWRAARDAGLAGNAGRGPPARAVRRAHQAPACQVAEQQPHRVLGEAEPLAARRDVVFGMLVDPVQHPASGGVEGD